MKDLVFLQHEQAVTTSLKVAEVFEKEHAKVMRSIEAIIADCAEMASERQTPKMADGVNTPMFQKSSYQPEEGGRSYPIYFINRDGFTLLAMGFTGKKALKFKLAYIDAFNKMEKALADRAFDFRAMRQVSIDHTKHLHKVIQEVVIPNARANGSTIADKYFHMHYERLINKVIGVQAGQRPNLSYGLQSDIARLDEVVEANIVKQAQAGANHREIYSSTKDTAQIYAEAALLGERTANLPKFIKPPKPAIKSTTVQISLF